MVNFFQQSKKSGEDFDLVHDIGPGRHFYQFYKSGEDLFKVLLPFWRAGVEKGDFCFWAVPNFITLSSVRARLMEVTPDLDNLISKGSFEMVRHQDWYGNGETFDGDMVMEKYRRKIESAIQRGFSLVRIAGDISGFKSHLWPAVREYEKKAHSYIETLPCVVICSYPLHELKLQQTKDVLDCHHDVLVAKV